MVSVTVEKKEWTRGKPSTGLLTVRVWSGISVKNKMCCARQSVLQNVLQIVLKTVNRSPIQSANRSAK